MGLSAVLVNPPVESVLEEDVPCLHCFCRRLSEGLVCPSPPSRRKLGLRKDETLPGVGWAGWVTSSPAPPNPGQSFPPRGSRPHQPISGRGFRGQDKCLKGSHCSEVPLIFFFVTAQLRTTPGIEMFLTSYEPKAIKRKINWSSLDREAFTQRLRLG